MISGRISVMYEDFIRNSILDAGFELEFAFVTVLVTSVLRIIVIAGFWRRKSWRNKGPNSRCDASFAVVPPQWRQLPGKSPDSPASQHALVLFFLFAFTLLRLLNSF